MAAVPPQITTDYPVHTRVLANGLKVVVSPDHAVPMVAVNIWYDVGSRDERPGEFGWAHLFEHLMFQGSANVSSGEHLQVMQNVGGAVNATTWFDRTNYFETVPVGALDLALWLEADRLATLPDHLDEANVENQRQVVKEEKRQRYDNVPYGHVMADLVGLLFPEGHPYAHVTIGSMADLDAATPQAAADFFRRHYRPDNAVITLVGDITVKEAFKKVERALGGIRGWNQPPRQPVATLRPLQSRPRSTVISDVPADAVHLGWRLPQRDTRAFDAADLALAVLGQGMASRLQLSLVRGDALASGASAAALGLAGGTSLGYASARCLPGTTPDQIEEALFDQVSLLREHGPESAELDRAKIQFQRAWFAELAALDVRADQFSAYATLHNDPERVNRRAQEVASITTDEVAQVIEEWLEPESAAVLRYEKEDDDAN